ncbi:filamentous hemagglutinin family N-terminal domain-containing protein [Methylomagnum ishizawai]|uniref:Filamentous hemagglutinin family N-terminal domain-containing protein n=1 Tax=Methylomagnum ishizawai TaxID=1760988 RepID=A0A1Y6CT51_9GAMM|nr:filamentous haemagglutinin family protein [Methylomagnum ishizawai]SMF93477.1 filamentous hemagglutinin family N-terminal domain-containing protein [Methylomagnum ishizawai]
MGRTRRDRRAGGWHLRRAVRGLLLCGGIGAARAELPVPAAAWATAGQATREVVGNAMTIHQQTDKAILNWQSFDIGLNNAVHFKQPGPAAVALNRIGPGDQPSRILGTLDANGQVYLVNPNGFVFGPGAQVNVNSLVASTLNISDAAFNSGLTKLINQSQGSEPVAALTGTGQVYRQDAQGRPLLDAHGQPLKISIETQPGSRIASNAAGGRILLVAPAIVNQGTVSAPDGQVVLAAATDKVYLQEADADSKLRGILVEVKTGGDIQNLGKLVAARGNVTALGYMIHQQGRVSASTSVSLNGTVRLLAREGAAIERDSNGALHLVPQTTRRASDLGDGLGLQATVSLDAGSTTRVDLDASKGKAVDEQAQTPSRVEIGGGKIVMAAGSALVAHGGQVDLTASAHPAHPLLATTADNPSRIVLEPGSRIDVSGSRKTVLPMSRNVVSVELRDNELRDSPLQKDGILHGQTVQVDIRKGTPLADISGAIARIRRSVQERNANGGTVNLESEGDVLFGQGAVVDVSGGAVRYLDGWLKTTQLVSGDQVYDIAQADPNRHYDALLGRFSLLHPRWNITQTWDLPGPVGQGRFEQGYTEGQSAGTLNIQARDLSLDGTVKAATVADRYQRAISERPAGGTLSIDLAWSGQRQQAVEFRNLGAPLKLSASDPVSGFGADGTPPTLVLGNELFRGGVQKLQISSGGRIAIAQDTDLELPAAGSLDLDGGAVSVEGNISAPSGSITLATQHIAGAAETLSGDLQLGAATRLDTSGLWVNDQPGNRQTLDPVALPIAGGSIALHAVGGLDLAEGSRISADGGAWLAKNGKVTAGAGGSIALGVAGNTPTTLALGASLSAHGLSAGGSLAITANAIRVGADPDPDPAEAAATQLNLAPDTLAYGGFGQIALTANGGDLSIAPGTALDLRLETWELDRAYPAQASGTPLAGFSHAVLQPEAFRTPVDLTLTLDHDAQVGAYDPQHSLSLGAGASIATDPGGKIALVSDTGIRIDGTLSAPAGTIQLTINPIGATLDRGYDPNQAIRLGPDARLLAQGAVVAQPNNAGLILGQVEAGGTVALTAHRGYVLMDRDAVIDVSGTAAPLDIPQDNQGGYARRLIGSDGGTIALTAAEGIVADGKLSAQAGAAPGASGGGLSLTLDARSRGFATDNLPADALPIPTGARTLHLAQIATAQLAAGAALDGAIPASLNGQAYLGADQVEWGGFASLALKTAVAAPGTPGFQAEFPKQGSLQFEGDVSLKLAQSLTLDSPILAWNRGQPGDTGTVDLSANSATLGSSLNRTGAYGTQGGDGRLNIKADWIDLTGSTELQGFQQTGLHSRNDIRLIGLNPNAEGDLLGQFAAAGEIDLAARQIYPSTLSQFTLQIDPAQNPAGLIRILPGDTQAKAPLSAGGQLNLSAARIDSQGVLRAPLGQIKLDASQSLDLAAGSLTSVSAQGLIIPFGRTQGGLDWIFPLGADDRIIESPPTKSIQLQGPAVRVASGAKLDLSGGGDLQAFEFIQGPGGSTDQLDPNDPGYLDGSFSYQEKYAILPQFGSAYAPYDPIEFQASGLKLGDSIYLGAGSGLPAGRYVLLPAHYALLPGAFLVTPQTGTTDLPMGSHYTRLDGSTVVAGYRYTADTGFRDARTSGYTVEPGRIARTRSEYEIHRANAFYPQRAQDQDQTTPRLPLDAGSLVVAADQSLQLAGTLAASAANGGRGGRGGRVDIAASRLSIVPTEANADSVDDGSVALAAADLNRLNVESLLLGGSRSSGDDGTTRLNLTAQSVTVAPGTSLQGQEIILAAQDRVDIGAGATLQAQGKAVAGDGVWQIGAADGTYTGSAWVRLSTGPQIDLKTDPLADAAHTGSLAVNAGAVLSATGSMGLYGTVDNRLQGNLKMDGGSLALGAERISLGSAPAATPGLVLGDALLNSLKVDELRLTAAGSLDVYGDAGVNAQSLVVQSAGLRGWGAAGQTARITADQVSFTNPDGATATDSGTGLGDLVVTAQQIQTGSGDQTWNGFHSISLMASDAFLVAGTTTWRVDSDLSIATGKLAALAGANLALDAGSHRVTLDPLAGGKSASVAEGLGARLDIQAASISVATPIVLPAGSLSLAASGDIALNSGTLLDAGGRAVTLGGKTLYAPGGSVALSSAAGNIDLAAGARITVAADAGGGDAGSLEFSAGQGRVNLDGGLSAQAGQAGAGGSFSLDALNLGLAHFSALNTQLQAAGFSESLALRFRQGDIAIAQGDTVRAHSLNLTADNGSIALSGSLDARGEQGGTVALNAGQTVRLTGTARIKASATASDGDGGTVVLNALGDGSRASGVQIEAGANIDVAAGGSGQGGTVRVRAGRVGTDDAAVAIAPGTVSGVATLEVEAVRVYRDIPLTNANIAAWYAETAAYMDAATNNPDLQTRLGGFQLTPGLDIQASGDLNLDLGGSLAGHAWTATSSAQVWTTRLDDIAGPVGGLTQIGSDGTARTLTAGTSSLLGSDGSYYFDADPASPTFRQLFVRVFPSGGNRYDPGQIKGDLVEANGWDFSFPDSQGNAWRFGPDQVPGHLTLRAAGGLTIGQNLSDGFVTYNAQSLANFFQIDGAAPNLLDTLMPQPGFSWSYRLAAGADLGSADPAATAGAAHDLVIGAGASVRTGTGDISATASGDIKLTDSRSTIYTAGRPTDAQRYGSFGFDLTRKAFYAEYPVDGGDLSLSAQGDIIGAATSQLMSDWLVRTGSWNPDDGIDTKDRPTAWGIAFDNLVVAGSSDAETQNLKFGFRQNLGALGGGDITVRAGGTVRDLSAMLPTTAKPTGSVGGDGQITQNTQRVRGGGDLRITAGGDIAGGVFYVEQGTAQLTAQGAVIGGSQYTAGPVFALGDARFEVRAAQGIAVGAALNPFTLTASAYTDKTAYFSTYSAQSSLNLQSSAGTVALNNDTGIIQQNYLLYDATTPDGRPVLSDIDAARMLTLYPGSLQAYALGGGLVVGHSFDLFPAAQGDLELLADGDIHFDQGGQVFINQSDTDPALLLPVSAPQASLNDAAKRLDIFNLANTDFLHATVPVHQDDPDPVLIASEHGDIVSDHASLLVTAEPAEVSAGRDIVGLGLELQNLRASDISEIRAGRDIRFPILRDPVTGDLDSSLDGLPISAAGPGQLQVLAGRDLDLGTSAGITTLGNLTNPALPAGGASITAWAGLGRAPDYPGFIQTYLQGRYAGPLTLYMRALLGDPNLDSATALARFQALPAVRQRELILAVLFRELKAAGIAAARTTDPVRRAAAYRRGEQAIATLLPGQDDQGDMKLFFSKIQTLDGGDIQLMAPGGLIDVGLATAFSGNKTAADLGIVAQRSGRIEALSQGDFRVNQSRVFTLGGGDITLWSEQGDIDAGRGAKAALSAPSPTYSFDAKGNLVVVFPAAVSGSGIRAQSGSTGADIGAGDTAASPLTGIFGDRARTARFGDVTLVAPRGVVNAGEAGIGGKNVAIAATAIIGVSNIQVTGNLTGAPPPPPSLTAVLTGANTLAAGANTAAQSALDDNLAATRAQVQTPATGPAEPAQQSSLHAQVVGFGQCSLGDIRRGSDGCR